MEDLSTAKKIGIERRISSFCKKNKIKILNITELIKNVPREKRQVSIVDSHASSEVNKIVGKKLSNYIIP
jgi:hypothetical protein